MSLAQELPPDGGALAPELVARLAAQMDALPLPHPGRQPLSPTDAAAHADTPPTMAGVQPLPATMAWDWHTAATGTTDPAQYYLVDTMPVSADPRTQYRSSGSSMSSAYADVVNLLTDFPNPQRLQQVRNGLDPPSGNPADSPNPPGWTKVAQGSGILAWRPDWVVTETPGDWIAGIAGSTKPPMTLRFSLRDIYGRAVPAMHELVMAATTGSDLSPVPLQAGELHVLEITARAWGSVNVYPGSWYDPSIVALGRYATFRNNIPPAQMIGPHGLLRAQVTGLLVAADPRVAVTVNTSYAQRNADRLRSATTVHLAGWVFPNTPQDSGAPLVQVRATNSAQTTTLVAASAPGAPPQIAGIYVVPAGG